MHETISVVDENDNLIKGEDRKVVHSSKMWHRGIHIMIFNSKGELLIQLRSKKKDKYPNTYDISISGHVGLKDGYEETAIREMKEELGISGVGIEELLHFRMPYGPQDYHVCKLFQCFYDGKVKSNDEISEIKFIGLEDLRKIILRSPERFTPWFVEIIKWKLGMENKLTIMSS